MKGPHINRIALIIIALSLVFIGSCTYYKPITTSPSLSSAAKSKELESMSQRTFIIRSNQGVFLLKNPIVRTDEEILTGTLQPVPEENQVYIKDYYKTYSYETSNPSVLQELHIYVQLDGSARSGTTVSIPVSSIEKIEIIQKDKSRSNTNTVILATGITLAALVMGFLISFLTGFEALI